MQETQVGTVKSLKIWPVLISLQPPHTNELCQKYAEGTRGWLFDQVSACFNDSECESGAFIFWGEPGMGKSVISAVLCREMASKLACSHFFRHDQTMYNDARLFLESLVLQICDAVPGYKQALTNEIFESCQYDFNEKSVEDVFAHFFVQTFADMSHDSSGCFVIVIDGIDDLECASRRKFIDLISNHFDKLPEFIRFVVTSNSKEGFENLNPLYLEYDGVMAIAWKIIWVCSYKPN